MKRLIKGSRGYLEKKKKQEMLKTVILFLLPLILFAVGYFTTHTKQNLLTIVAVLGLLPACKSMVSMIMYMRAEGCSEEASEAISREEGRLIGMYDMYFTSYQKNFPIGHMIVEDKVVLGFTESRKCDLNLAQEHLQTMLKQGGIKETTVSITNQLQKYCEQLEKLNEKTETELSEKDDEIRVILYDISL